MKNILRIEARKALEMVNVTLVLKKAHGTFAEKIE